MKKRVKVLMLSMLALSFLAIPVNKVNAEQVFVECSMVYHHADDVCRNGFRYMEGSNTKLCVYRDENGYLYYYGTPVPYSNMIGTC